MGLDGEVMEGPSRYYTNLALHHQGLSVSTDS